MSTTAPIRIPTDFTPIMASRAHALLAALRHAQIIGSQNPRNMEARMATVIRREIDELKETQALTSVKSVLTKYRKAIEMNGIPEAIPYLVLTPDELAELRVQYLTQIEQDQKALRPLDPEKTVNIATELLAEKSYLRRTVGVMLLTGRRVIEVLKVGEFEEHGETTLLFGGQAKTRDREGTRQDPYPIPTLADPSTVLTAIARIREDAGDLLNKPNAQVTTSISKNLGIYTREAFGEEWKPKDLRGAYAQTCYEYFCPKSTTDTVYFSQILGHKLLGDEVPDMMTAQSYRDFYIQREITIAPEQVVRHQSQETTFLVLDVQEDAGVATLHPLTKKGQPDKRMKPIQMRTAHLHPTI